MFREKHDIDFVVPWVDGSDPAWLEEKSRYRQEKSSSNCIIRYRDWGLMKYWFRAIEKYAPFFRKVHFVTWGHIPDFLNTGYAKLNVVRHEEFIPREYLPTFSANCIELNLYKIEELADRFVYFNDDIFLNSYLKEEYFFRGGLPCSCFAELPICFFRPVEMPVTMEMNDISVINKHFIKRNVFSEHFRKIVSGKYTIKDQMRNIAMRFLVPSYFTGLKHFHCPASFHKNTFEDLWEKEPELLHQTCLNKYRSKSDVNQWLAVYWQLASGKFSPRRTDIRIYGINEETIDTICEDITRGRHSMICINDTSESCDYEGLAAKLDQAFRLKLPDKSAFEK